MITAAALVYNAWSQNKETFRAFFCENDYMQPPCNVCININKQTGSYINLCIYIF